MGCTHFLPVTQLGFLRLLPSGLPVASDARLAIAGYVADAAEPSFDVAVIKPVLRMGWALFSAGSITAPSRRPMSVSGDFWRLLMACRSCGSSVPTGWTTHFDIMPNRLPEFPTLSRADASDASQRPLQARAHRESRVMAVYNLTVVRDGVKMPVYPAHDKAPDHPGAGQMLRGTLTAGQFAEKLPASSTGLS